MNLFFPLISAFIGIFTYIFLNENNIGEKYLVTFQNKTESSFKQYITNFPWNEFEQNNTKYVNDLIYGLTDYLIKEPLINNINELCKPKQLPVINCLNYGYSYNFTKEQKRIGHLIQFGFDVDILEIHLNEVYDIIDFFLF